MQDAEAFRDEQQVPGYDGATGELELAFYPLGITSLAAEAAMIGQLTRRQRDAEDREERGWHAGS